MKKSGITLISLVISIIVLLILAGVSINLVAGGDGIIEKASEAVTKGNNSKIIDEIELARSGFLMSYYLDSEDMTQEEYMGKKLNGYEISDGGKIYYQNDLNIYTYVKNGEAIFLKIDDNNKMNIIEENMKISTFSLNTKNEITEKSEISFCVFEDGVKNIQIKLGEITIYNKSFSERMANDSVKMEEFGDKIQSLEFLNNYDLKLYVNNEEIKTMECVNYTVSTKEDMQKLATVVNSGNNMSGKTIYQLCDIDLECNAENQWTPIGKNLVNYFSGKYQGNVKSISGMYIKGTQGDIRLGLFGVLKSGEINNINLKDSVIETSNWYVGGICSTMENLGIISNCQIDSTVSIVGTGWVGGICGYLTNRGTVEKCSFYGNIDATNQGSGGIIGHVADNATISKCTNYGIVCGKANVGGIIGVGAGSMNCSFNVNKGEIKFSNSGSWTLGGIVGYSGTNKIANIDCCYNVGTLPSGNQIGGILGGAKDDSNVEISNCYNISDITGNATLGGIIGGIDASNEEYLKKISNCYNVGNITGTSYFGSIYGKSIGEKIEVENCYYLKGCVSASGTQSDGQEEIEDMKTSDFIELLGDEFIEDTQNINNGYPILKWQQDK